MSEGIKTSYVIFSQLQYISYIEYETWFNII